MDKERNREGNARTVSHWLKDDGIHLRQSKFTERVTKAMEDIFGWTEVPKQSIGEEIRRSVEKKCREEGRCRSCGSRDCRNACRKSQLFCKKCDKSGHNERACSVLNYRPCYYCGISARHNRKPCAGW
jgi:hypothetical protein